MDETPQWVWYQDKIALVMGLDSRTGFIQLQVMERQVENGYTWEAIDEPVIASLDDTHPVIEHEIEEIRPGVFQLDEGDVTYEPSTESDEEEYNF